MELRRVSEDVLKEYSQPGYGNSVFTTYEWIAFLKKNQKAEPVVIELISEDRMVGIFVGLMVKKFGIRILGSPFEGWLTPDMGFICIEKFDYEEAIADIAKYAFKKLHCWLVQIIDKNITSVRNFKHQYTKILQIDNSREPKEILEQFTKNGRRDVRASRRKGLSFKKVPFNKEFADLYYDQLIDVFAKQNRTPTYKREKIYDLIDAFGEDSSKILALVATTEEGAVAGTLLSVGFENWAYYLGAASYRAHQHFLPNEGLFWEFLNYWNQKKAIYIDLVGDRPYKRKYNPKIYDLPMIYVEKFPGVILLKKMAHAMITFIWKLKGKVRNPKTHFATSQKLDD